MSHVKELEECIIVDTLLVMRTALEPWLLGHAMLICVSFSRDARKKGKSHKKQKTKDREHHRRHSQHVKRYAFIILTKYVF